MRSLPSAARTFRGQGGRIIAGSTVNEDRKEGQFLAIAHSRCYIICSTNRNKGPKRCKSF